MIPIVQIHHLIKHTNIFTPTFTMLKAVKFPVYAYLAKERESTCVFFDGEDLDMGNHQMVI